MRHEWRARLWQGLLAAAAPWLVAAVTAADPEPVENAIGMRFVAIAPGEFAMGSDDELLAAAPVHRVRITRPFLLGQTEVTNQQWSVVMGKPPSLWTEAELPVEQVTWHDADRFCRKLSSLPIEHARRRVYRLPTEAEWEYACRAGSTTRFSFGDDEAALGDYAWFEGNSDLRTHPVCRKRPNAWGLYDMHGNVWEWCSDWKAAYPQDDVSDPIGPPQGSDRVFRGNGWHGGAAGLQAALRAGSDPTLRSPLVGLRVVLEIDPAAAAAD